MELIEAVGWTLAGFISTLATMEIAWRLARKQAKASITKPIPMKQGVRGQ